MHTQFHYPVGNIIKLVKLQAQTREHQPRFGLCKFLTYSIYFVCKLFTYLILEGLGY